MIAVEQIVGAIRRCLLYILLFFTFVSICVAGPLGVYLALAAVLASLIFAFDPACLRAVLRDWGVRGFLVSFVVISLSFLPSAHTGEDLLAFFDFLALPIIVPATALLARFARPGNVMLIGILALVGAVIALVIGFSEVRIQGMARAYGNPLSSPIFFSNLSVLLCFFCLLGLVGSTSRWRWLLLLGNAAGLGAAFFGGTRAAMVAYGLLLLLALGYAVLAGRRAPRDRLVTIAAIIGTPLVGLLFLDTSRLTSIFVVASDAAQGAIADPSTKERLVIYHGAIRAILDSPLYGHGWWHRFEAAAKYMGPLGAERLARDTHSHLHNDILNFGASGGIIAIVGYLILMASPIISAIRSPRTANWNLRVTAAFGLVGAYLLMGAVDVTFVFEIPKTMYVLCSAVIMAFFLDAPPVTPSLEPKPARVGR